MFRWNTISRNENETVQEQRQSYLYDLTDHQWLDASSLLDENALKWLSANLRAQLKADDNWKEAAYTLPLIEATAWDSGNFSDFTLKDGMLIFNFPAGLGKCLPLVSGFQFRASISCWTSDRNLAGEQCPDCAAGDRSQQTDGRADL